MGKQKATPEHVKEAKKQLFVALVTTSPFILYFVGRWYKEWYFAQFSVYYSMLRFDVFYYVFGSWATMLVAATTVAIGMNLWLRFLQTGQILGRSVAIGLCVLALLRVVVLRLEFNPAQHFVTKLVTSADISLICLGLAAFAHGVSSRNVRATVARKFDSLLMGSPLVWWVALVLFWAYCGVVGYTLGTYHGQKAIWEGKMGLHWVTVKGDARRWILVEQADEERVFLFDRERRIARPAKREDILEMQERVSR